MSYIYCKNINGKLIPVDNTTGITGIINDPNIAIEHGYIAYDSIEFAEYQAGIRELMLDGTLKDITQTDEYKTKVKKQAVQALTLEYADYFKELDRICGAKFARGLCTKEQIETNRGNLQNELTTKIQEINNG